MIPLKRRLSHNGATISTAFSTSLLDEPVEGVQDLNPVSTFGESCHCAVSYLSVPAEKTLSLFFVKTSVSSPGDKSMTFILILKCIHK